MGHSIGLHLDSEDRVIQSESDLEKYLIQDRRMLEDFFDVEIKVFSFHNPTPFLLDNYRQWSYGGLINTYADYFQKEVGYCSDSNGYWRHRRLYDVLEKAEDSHLQVLTHPEWWQENTMSPKERIERCIQQRALRNWQYYDSTLKAAERLIIDWEDERKI